MPDKALGGLLVFAAVAAAIGLVLLVSSLSNADWSSIDRWFDQSPTNGSLLLIAAAIYLFRR